MRALVLASLLAALPLVAQQQPDPRIAEGIALHDAGKFEEAIARYKAVLADDPENVLATYELSLTYQAKGDYARCRATAEPHASRPTRFQAAFLTTLANCLDHLGESDKAIAMYRKGLALAPDDPMLLFNLAITLIGRNQYADARELLKKELTVRPTHGSGHYYLGQVFEHEAFRSAAILAYLRFLAIEPEGGRAKDAVMRALGLIRAGVEKKGKNITISIDPKARTEEGDFQSWEMMLAIVSLNPVEEAKLLSDFENTRMIVAGALRALIEARSDLGLNYSTTTSLPFFAELEEKKLLDAYAGVALSSLDLTGENDWRASNAKQIDAFRAFMQERAR